MVMWYGIYGCFSIRLHCTLFADLHLLQFALLLQNSEGPHSVRLLSIEGSCELTQQPLSITMHTFAIYTRSVLEISEIVEVKRTNVHAGENLCLRIRKRSWL